MAATTEIGYAHDPRRWGAWLPVLSGFFVIIALFGGMFYWSMNTQLNGAVIAQGELRVESNQKPVQHREGGVVGEIFVRDGDRVKAGDPLLRLDQTTQEASLEIVDTQLTQFLAERARLLAERDEVDRIEFPRDVLGRAATDPDVDKVVRDQRNLFAARRAGYRQQGQQLGERIGQLRNEIQAVEARREGFDTQLISVREELAVQRGLLERGLTTRSRMQDFRREEARIIGEIGALNAEESRLRRQIQETEIEITKLRESRREEAIERLREVDTRAVEMQQRMIVAKDALRKIELRSPQDGIVQDMTIFAAGAVVRPGEPIMVIVPTEDRLVLEARVETSKRDQISIGQPARVRFTTFNHRKTPELNAEVLKISADRKIDDATQIPYFAVEILISDEERARLGEENVLVPGMPADIFIQTEARTPLTYLLKPLTDNFERAGRER